eukprot:3612117-Rhodomonas_salina.1
MLEIEERQVGISIEEVESDLKKLKGYQDGLSRLVSTRYDDDEYEKSVILIQKIYRGRKDWKIGKKLKEEKQARELEDAAIKIQKIQRGRRIRIMQKDDAMVKANFAAGSPERTCRSSAVGWRPKCSTSTAMRWCCKARSATSWHGGRSRCSRKKTCRRSLSSSKCERCKRQSKRGRG